jgi:hypothetical protein
MDPGMEAILSSDKECRSVNFAGQMEKLIYHVHTSLR